MTKDQFLNKLARMKCEWISKRGRIRTYIDGYQFCPLTAMAYKKEHKILSVEEFITAASVLRIRFDTALNVAQASDGTTNNSNLTRWRKRLEKATRI